MPKLVQISFSPILDDPRVRRNNDGLKKLGWDVCAIGFGYGKSNKPEWEIYSPPVNEHAENINDPELITNPPAKGIYKKARRIIWFSFAFFLSYFICFFAFFFRLFKRNLSDFLFETAKIIRRDIGWPVRILRSLKVLPNRFKEDALEKLKRRLPIDEFIDIGKKIGAADIYVANDWTALPVAFALQNEFGGKVVYDSHEFALEEYAQNWAWRTFERPIAMNIEKKFIKQTMALSAVSLSIAKELQKTYDLNVPCIEILNAPEYKEINERAPEVGNEIKVLYHGIVAPGRGLEAAISSIANWNKEFTFYVRGPASTEYLESLKDLVSSLNLENRVNFLSPVPMIDLVASAREFDVGFFALPNYSAQNRFALPNKFFEYIQAGLCLLVSDLPEMKRFIDEYGCGTLIEGASEANIAKAINALDKNKIMQMKLNSRVAAKILKGQNEAKKLDELYKGVLT
ncbi:MAG: glycosyltransferase [Caulobacterales bacterium]|nr:glycosyltransferase [Caulobacterales bacterium]MCA0373383.1 glycosyltransferase [Pseudomonadota bacterium]